jgi:hypothetical protein
LCREQLDRAHRGGQVSHMRVEIRLKELFLEHHLFFVWRAIDLARTSAISMACS